MSKEKEYLISYQFKENNQNGYFGYGNTVLKVAGKFNEDLVFEARKYIENNFKESEMIDVKVVIFNIVSLSKL